VRGTVRGPLDHVSSAFLQVWVKSMEDVARKIGSSSDRFRESHFWIHSMEQFYHYADPFRWHLNAFLRSLKKVPQLLHIELQNEVGFSEWFREYRANLVSDPLISFLSKQRD
jgi:hypothetical protein